MSTVKSVEQALKTPARDPMSAERSPATTIPRRPGGRRYFTMSGNAACASDGIALPLAPMIMPSSATFPLFASAKQMSPGMMNRNTGKSFRNAAKMLPRRATFSFGAPRARWTMYWSVHQYQSPMMGAQISMPGQGNLSLKYQACLTMAPDAFVSRTGSHVDCWPAGVMGFQRLNISDPQ